MPAAPTASSTSGSTRCATSAAPANGAGGQQNAALVEQGAAAADSLKAQAARLAEAVGTFRIGH